MDIKFADIIRRDNSIKSQYRNKKPNETTIEFIVSNPDFDKNLLGRYNHNQDKVEIFLSKIGESCYKAIKRENKDLFNFLNSDSNKRSNALDKEYFEDAVDEQLFDSTSNKLTEVLLHELTHKFGNVGHPQDYKAGISYFINSYIYKLYTDVNFSEMEKEVKGLLKTCYNIQSYTTNDFNSKIKEIISYCNDK
ncbi:MAG: hypothetical protein ACP5MV_03985 [Candidatus Parvarchaeum sp.]